MANHKTYTIEERKELIKNNKMFCLSCKEVMGIDAFYANPPKNVKISKICRKCHSKKYKKKYVQNLNPKNKERRELMQYGKARCNTCREIKPLSAFNKNKGSINGVGIQCIECAKANY